MCKELAGHLNILLKFKADKSLSIFTDNHEAHMSPLQRRRETMGSIDHSIDQEEYDVGPELINQLGLALCIASDN
jgi:hypothetical protein